MPAFRIASASRRTLATAVALLCLAIGGTAVAAAEPDTGKSENSGLDAALFYQLLLGEIELREGQAGSAYKIILDAAKRSKDEQLFKRATEIALQARAGDQAFSAVLAWRQALPDSLDALRYQIQLLVVLNRIADVEEPLAALLRQTARPALPGLIDALPRFLARATDRDATAALIERTLRPYADAADTRVPALVAIGRAWPRPAIGRRRSTSRVAPAMPILAPKARPSSLSTCCRRREAEAIVKRHLAGAPRNPSVRLLYVRTLATSQRLAEATAEIEVLTKSDPNLAPPWLTLGALQLEMKRPREATASLLNYVRLVEGGAAVNFGVAASAPQGSGGEDEDTRRPTRERR